MLWSPLEDGLSLSPLTVLRFPHFSTRSRVQGKTVRRFKGGREGMGMEYILFFASHLRAATQKVVGGC